MHVDILRNKSEHSYNKRKLIIIVNVPKVITITV